MTTVEKSKNRVNTYIIEIKENEMKVYIKMV